MSKLSKTLLLAASSGLAVVMLFFISAIVGGERPPNLFKRWDNYVEIFSLFMIVSAFSLIFVTPFLYFIDKYFGRYKSRYIIGSVPAGLGTWLWMTALLLPPSPWVNFNYWASKSVNYLPFIVGPALCTGLLFTALLWLIERRKRNKQ